MNTIKIVFNRSLPIIGGDIELREGDNWAWGCLGQTSPEAKEVELAKWLDEIICFKYADIDFARERCHSHLVRRILEDAPIVGRHKRVLVDIKMHNLRPGFYPCKPGFHLDGSSNHKGVDKQPELHHLFVASVSSRTEFLDDPAMVELDPSWDFATRSRKIGVILDEMNPPTFTIPNCRFVTYDDTYFHRCVQVKTNEKRLLVRVTETDVIDPRNHPYEPESY